MLVKQIAVNNRIKKSLQFILSLGLMGLFLYWAFSGIDTRDLWQTISTISAKWVALIFATTMLTLTLRAWRWIVLLKPFAPQVKNLDASLALAICYTANVIVTRSGEALRAISLKWTRGAPISAVLATVVVERFLDLFWLIVYLGASLLLLRDRINEAFPWLESGSLAVLALSIAGLVILVLISIYRERALAFIDPILKRFIPPWADKITSLLETFIQGLVALQHPSAYIKLIASSILLNTLYVCIIWETFAGLGLDQKYGLGFEAALVIMAISSIGIVIPTQGGIGTYHLFFSKGLNLLYDVPMSEALACATLAHALATLTYLLIGGPALFWQWRQNRAGKSASAVPTFPSEHPND